ncbi:MAG TPA: alpha/beta hydrolase [Stellaceae bacterium]|nr:alpha/beta hydrolase [Stellaceae bacterium]
MEFITAPDGVRLATYEWGNPAGPEIVLIHGFAQAHLCFARQFESELARDYRIVSYDHRGHGASDKPLDPKAYQSGEIFAKDLALVLETKRLKRPVLAGWSMGGRITRQYLLLFGDSRLAGLNFVSALVVEDTSCRGPGAPKLPPPHQTLAQDIEASTAFIDGCFAIKPSEADFRVALAYNMLAPANVRRAILGWPSNPEATLAGLKMVRVPTLVTHGRKDTVVLPRAAERTAETISGARISWFDQCGHSPFCEDAPRFNRELAQFVKRVN